MLVLNYVDFMRPSRFLESCHVSEPQQHIDWVDGQLRLFELFFK